jgi:hypothetical protein
MMDQYNEIERKYAGQNDAGAKKMVLTLFIK